MSLSTVTINQEVVIPASPEKVYKALVDPTLHSAFSGAPAANTDSLSADYSSYGGFCVGRNLELVPNKRIHQTWRTTDENWPAGHITEVTYTFEPHGDGTLLKLTHTAVPDVREGSISDGWNKFYWEPLKTYFSNN